MGCIKKNGEGEKNLAGENKNKWGVRNIKGIQEKRGEE